MKRYLIILFTTYIMQAQTITTVDYTDVNQKLEGILAQPTKNIHQKAGILLLPAWMGVDNNAKENAKELSKLGYITFVADIYGVDKRPKDTKEAGQIAGHYKTNSTEYHKRIQLALDQLIKAGANPNKIAVIGYCFGGTGAIEAARSNMKVQGVVSFHGGLGRDINRPVVSITPKVLVLHGADDFFVPESDIKAFQDEMRKANADWQMIYYADAVHAFTHKDAGNDKSKGAAYNAKAAKRSWEAMKVFFEEILK